MKSKYHIQEISLKQGHLAIYDREARDLIMIQIAGVQRVHIDKLPSRIRRKEEDERQMTLPGHEPDGPLVVEDSEEFQATADPRDLFDA